MGAAESTPTQALEADQPPIAQPQQQPPTPHQPAQPHTPPSQPAVTPQAAESSPSLPTSPSTAAPPAAAAAPADDPESRPLIEKVEAPAATADAPASSSAFRATGGPPGVGEDHLDTWYALVEWVSSSLDTGIVLAWDSEEVGHRVLALPRSQTLLDTLAAKQAERKRTRLAALHAEKLAKQAEENRLAMQKAASASLIPVELQPLSPTAAAASVPPTIAPVAPAADVPFHLASELLQIDRPLAALRHTFVPSRVSEDTFWTVYFDAVLATITAHVLELQQPEEQLQDTNPHADSK